MKRDGGALLALPVGLIAMEALQTVSLEDPASDLGPHTVVPVPGVKEADGSLQLLGSDLDVLLVDVSDAVVANLVPMELSDLDPTSVLGFHEDVSYHPDAATLLKLTKEWVASATAERVQFYSADEGGPAEEQTAVPKQKAKAKASTDKPKTVSAAKQVASHIQQISSLLPNMASQLAEIQEEQKNMREAFRLQNMLPPPRGTQTPVTMPMQSFAMMLGASPSNQAGDFCLASSKEGSCGVGFSFQRSGAGRGGGSAFREEPFGNGDAGAEQSADNVGISPAEWGPPCRQPGSLLRHFLSWVPRKRKAAARAIAEERRILLGNHAECLQEDEASQFPSRPTWKNLPMQISRRYSIWSVAVASQMPKT